MGVFWFLIVFFYAVFDQHNLAVIENTSFIQINNWITPLTIDHWPLNVDHWTLSAVHPSKPSIQQSAFIKNNIQFTSFHPTTMLSAMALAHLRSNPVNPETHRPVFVWWHDRGFNLDVENLIFQVVRFGIWDLLGVHHFSRTCPSAWVPFSEAFQSETTSSECTQTLVWESRKIDSTFQLSLVMTCVICVEFKSWGL